MSYTRDSSTNYTDHDFINKSSVVAEIGDRLATVDIGRKVGDCCGVPLSLGGIVGSSSNTMSPEPRPTSIPSGILIYPTVWPQYTNVTDRQDRHENGTAAYRANRYL